MTYKFYSEIAITGTYLYEDDYGYMTVGDDKIDVDNSGMYLKMAQKSFSEFTSKIDGFKEKGLALYLSKDYDAERVLYEKLSSIKPSIVAVTDRHNREKVFLLTKCEADTKLTFNDIDMLKEYITGQFSDGVGESFEQQDYESSVEIDVPTVNFHLWSRYGYELMADYEFENRGYKLVENMEQNADMNQSIQTM